MDQSKKQGRISSHSHPKGFGTLTILLAIMAFTAALFYNVNSIQLQMKNIKGSSSVVGAKYISSQLQSWLDDSNVISNLKANIKLSDGSGVNLGPKTLGMKCILQKIHSIGTTSCNHKSQPAKPSDKCKVYKDPEGQRLCWIKSTLEKYKIDVLFSNIPGDNSVDTLFIDNRDTHNGLSSNLNICKTFNKNDENLEACPYRVELYAWVECRDNAATCLGKTTIGGDIKIAAILTADRRISPFSSKKYSILNVDGGSL